MYIKTVLAAILISIGFGSAATAADDPIVMALKGCSTEIKTYCGQVTPGDGRLLSCISAHEDKLSGQCVYALNRASFIAESFVLALEYVGTACLQDAVVHCPTVELGDGRVLQCLASKSTSLSGPCKTALSDIGDLQ